jgi:hypothetical protein
MKLDKLYCRAPPPSLSLYQEYAYVVGELVGPVGVRITYARAKLAKNTAKIRLCNIVMNYFINIFA